MLLSSIWFLSLRIILFISLFFIRVVLAAESTNASIENELLREVCPVTTLDAFVVRLTFYCRIFFLLYLDAYFIKI